MITIAVKTIKHIEITEAEYLLLKNMSRMTINDTATLVRAAAIKFIKDQYGMSLLDAKYLVDTVWG